MDSLISFHLPAFTAWPPLSFMIQIDERKASLGSDCFKGKSTTTKALSIA
jgi:hypothetical protein